MTTPEVPREEIAAAVSARREMDRAYDDAFVDSIVERVNETIDTRLGHRQTADRPRREAEQVKGDRALMIVVACTPLGVSIPLTAIVANSPAGLPGIMIIWLGIAMVNLAAALRSRR
jgi:hypothetical protein